jgi:hypothetical protein
MEVKGKEYYGGKELVGKKKKRKVKDQQPKKIDCSRMLVNTG